MNYTFHIVDVFSSTPFGRNQLAVLPEAAGISTEAPTGAPSPTELAAVLSVEPAEVNQVFFAGVGVPVCFAQLNSNEVGGPAAQGPGHRDPHARDVRLGAALDCHGR